MIWWNNDSVPHVGGELNDSRVKEMKSLLPAASSLINMVVKAKEIDAGEFEIISEKLNKLVTDITTNDHIGKINALNYIALSYIAAALYHLFL